MFLKVETEAGDTVTYKLSSNDVFAGSASSNHIVISEKTVSKKHARFVLEQNKWYVVDQGSTNGTYIDDEQLIPGKKSELTVDGSVRLGANVTITLLKEAADARELNASLTPPARDAGSVAKATVPVGAAQSSISSDQDRTRVISLDDLRNAKAIAEQKRKREVAEKIAKEKKRKKEEMNRIGKIFLFCLAIVFAGVVANKLWRKRLKEVRKETIIKKFQTKVKGDEEIETDIEGFRIPRKALLSRNKIIDSLRAQKCRTETEKEMCGENAIFGLFNNGIIELQPGIFVVYLEEKSRQNEMRATLTEENKLEADTFSKLMFLHFFQEQLTAYPLPENASMYVAFYSYDHDKTPSLTQVAAVNAESSVLMLSELKELKLTGTDDEIKSVLTKLNPYFTVY